MKWAAVKREMAAGLGSIDLLAGRAYPWTARKISPPAFFLDPPDSITFHGAYADGMSRMVVPFSVAVGMFDAESSEDQLSEFLEETGPRSVKKAVEGHIYSSCSDVTVTRAEIVVMSIGGIKYLGALFSSDVTGRGD